MSKKTSICVATSLIVMATFINNARATTRDIALTLKVKGQASVKREDSSSWQLLTKGQRLHSGDIVRTGESAFVAVVFSDDRSMMKIRAESEVTFNGQRTDRGIAKNLSMSIGAIWAQINPGGAGFRMETPSGVAAVKGTEFYTIIDQFGLMTIICVDGLVELFNELGSVLVGKNWTGTLNKNEAPNLFETQNLDDWAHLDDGQQKLEIEFDKDGIRKNLEIIFKEK